MPPTQTESTTTAPTASASAAAAAAAVSTDVLQQDAAVAAAATSPRSADSNECAESSVSLDEEQQQKETIIVFDWDDTILSSSWLAGLGYRLDTNMQNAPASLYASLNTLAAAAIDLLRLAAQHGRVVVITNAETGWVQLSAQKFIPSIVPVLAELNVNIFSARSTFEPSYPDAPLKWKSAAFELVLNDTPGICPHTGKPIHKNVLSLGDSHVEREAVRQVTSEMQNTLCKSVKFAERPTCEQLTRQLTLVQNCFSYILNHANHLDLQLTVTVSEQNQQQAKEEEEKMRCQEQSLMAAHDDGCGNNATAAAAAALCMDEDEEEEEKVLEAF